MTDDTELRRTLRRWETGGAPGALRRRVINSYDELRPRSPWARTWRMRVSMPAPMAAVVLILLVAAGAWAGRLARQHEEHRVDSEIATAASGGLADLEPLPEIRVAVVRKVQRDAPR